MSRLTEIMGMLEDLDDYKDKLSQSEKEFIEKFEEKLNMDDTLLITLKEYDQLIEIHGRYC
jgi:ribonucleotide reductase beta subunit family protein with ferritin-like domain